MANRLVLIVDDAESVRVSISILLRQFAGIRTVAVATSEEALKIASRRRFDLVTSDINRPGMGGLDFLKVFKRAYPAVPVIVISGVMDETTASRARRLRAFGCLPKPFTCRELLHMVLAAIASRKVCRTRLRSHRASRQG